MRFEGKVAVVTGGARGLGAATARRLAAEGATVVVVDVLRDAGLEVATELGERGRFVAADVGDEADWARVVEVAEAAGGVHVLVNNASILHARAIERTSVEDYTRVFLVNQLGTFLGMRAVIAPMRRGGGGAIVNISSIDGIGSKDGLVAYTSSKGAVRAMTKTAAIELGPDRIRVNSVHPGGIYTPMAGSDQVGREVVDAYHAHLPLARAADPEEIAAAVAFLASEDASYCTGAELVVDGGWLAGDSVASLSRLAPR